VEGAGGGVSRSIKLGIRYTGRVVGCPKKRKKRNTQNPPWSSSFVVLFSLLRLLLLLLALFVFCLRALPSCILFCSKSLARIRFSVFSIFIYFLVGFFLLITDSAVQETFFLRGSIQIDTLVSVFRLLSFLGPHSCAAGTLGP